MLCARFSVPGSCVKQNICCMFSVLNEYKLFWKASWQEMKRLAYFKNKSLPQEYTQRKSIGYLTADCLQADKMRVYLHLQFPSWHNPESMYLTYSL